MIRTHISTDSMTDAEEAAIRAVEDALDSATRDGLTPSVAARQARITTIQARSVLGYLVRHSFAHTSGNGAWTHYHAGRA